MSGGFFRTLEDLASCESNFTLADVVNVYQRFRDVGKICHLIIWHESSDSQSILHRLAHGLSARLVWISLL